ncbi:MAG: arsenate reductase ArsC [Candidatus Krumholzibacteriia bacterium]
MRVLFVCTANSCRSQMAEGWARRLWPSDWEAHSAGLVTYPITAATREAMAEAGVDLTGQESKPIDLFWLGDFDLVVTLSEEAARFLPPLDDPARHRHHPVDDPMTARGGPEEIRAAFRRARDEIRAIVVALAPSAALPRDPVS